MRAKERYGQCAKKVNIDDVLAQWHMAVADSDDYASTQEVNKLFKRYSEERRKDCFAKGRCVVRDVDLPMSDDVIMEEIKVEICGKQRASQPNAKKWGEADKFILSTEVCGECRQTNVHLFGNGQGITLNEFEVRCLASALIQQVVDWDGERKA